MSKFNTLGRKSIENHNHTLFAFHGLEIKKRQIALKLVTKMVKTTPFHGAK
jgi:hypothetical protein